MEVNGEDTYNDTDTLTKSNSIDNSYTEDRRASYASNRSASDNSNSNKRQGSSRSSSVSEGEGYEQKTTANLKLAWETRNDPDAPRTIIKTKAIGGQTGANTLKERFENPSNERKSSTGRTGSFDLDGDAAKRVSTSSLRSRFEQKAAESAPPKRNFVINRCKTGEAAKKFNQIPSTSTKCMVCTKTVYTMDKLEVECKLYHKLCFKCETCKRTLGLGNYASLEGKFYCKPHLKQLFTLKGNYDEGFGREQRKSKWSNKETTVVQTSQKQVVKEVPKKEEEPVAEESENVHENGHVNGHVSVNVNGHDSEEELHEEEDEEKETEEAEYDNKSDEGSEKLSEDEYDD